MPSVLEPPSNEDEYNFNIDRLKASRQALKDLLENFPDDRVDQLIFRHPLAGRLSLVQALKFLNVHFDHHVKQIQRIRKALPG